MCPYDPPFSFGHISLNSLRNSFIINLLKTKEKSMNERTKKTTWTLILKVIITVATALAGALGLNACIG